MRVPVDPHEVVDALAALMKECNGHFGRNPYGVEAYRRACYALARAIDHPTSDHRWMDALDAHTAADSAQVDTTRYREGYRIGAADRYLGQRSRYAEAPEHGPYARGYRAGVLGLDPRP